MQKKLVSLTAELGTTIALGRGIAILPLPIVLHLWLGADNDAYVIVAEGARRDPVILLQAGLEWMFRVDFLLWPVFLIATGLGLGWLVRRWAPLAP